MGSPRVDYISRRFNQITKHGPFSLFLPGGNTLSLGTTIHYLGKKSSFVFFMRNKEEIYNIIVFSFKGIIKHGWVPVFIL